MLRRRKKPLGIKLSDKEREEGIRRREKIINDAQAMKRLQDNADFQRYCELLKEDREEMNQKLLLHSLKWKKPLC